MLANYLSNLFHVHDLAYRMINLHRSAISAKLPPYNGTPLRLDPVTHIKEYVRRMGKIRQSLQLVVLAKVPHKSASLVLISKYLKDAIIYSGQLGTGQSVRSRASTKARLGGASLGDVLKAGDWSRASTFRAFYFKPET